MMSNTEDPILRLLRQRAEAEQYRQENGIVEQEEGGNSAITPPVQATVVVDADGQLSLPGFERSVYATADDLIAEAKQETEALVESGNITNFAPRPKIVRRRGGYSAEVVSRIMQADRMHPGVRLARVCISKRISVAEVAKKLGVSRPTVYGWFLGTQYPKDEQLERIKELILTYTALHT